MRNFSIGVSEEKALSQFSDFINATGIIPKHNIDIIPDGHIHRFSLDTTDKGGAKSGAYCLHMDGCPAGWVQDWHGRKFNFKFDFSDEERREYGQLMHNTEYRAKAEKERREIERQKAEKLKLQKEEQAQARAMALKEFQHSKAFCHETGIFPQHPYFVKKFMETGLYLPIIALNYCKALYPICIVCQPLEGGICKKGEVLIPMLNVRTGDFQSLIHIPTTPYDRGKFSKLIYGKTSQTGAAYVINTPKSLNADTLLVCEGITTAFAVMLLTQGAKPVFSAGNCGNLLPVCRGLRERYPDKRIIVMGDNDIPVKGRKAGQEAAQTCLNEGVADDYKTPPIEGEDFYDYLVRTMKKGE